MLNQANVNEFVRIEEVFEIERLIKNGESIKLIGIPKIGISYIMQYIHLQSTSIKECFENYISFYINDRYTLSDIKDSFYNQLENINIKNFTINSNYFDLILHEVFKTVKAKYPDKKILFILDDFQKNFVAYNENSILNEPAIKRMKDVSNTLDLSIIVSYNYPLDSELRDDWYLNNFFGKKINYLLPDACKKLLRIKFEKKQMQYSETIFNQIMYYCGGYPFLLDNISFEDIGSEKPLKVKIEHRYEQILFYLRNKGSYLYKDENYYINYILKTIKPTFTVPENEFIERYFSNKIINNKNHQILVCEYFEEWFLKKHDIMPVNSPPPPSAPLEVADPMDKGANKVSMPDRLKLFIGITMSIVIIIAALLTVVVMLKKYGIEDNTTIFMIFGFSIFIGFLVILAVIAPSELSSKEFIKASKLLFLSMGSFVENLLSAFSKNKKEKEDEEKSTNINFDVLKKTIEFDFKSSEIRQVYYYLLDDIAETLKENQNVIIEVSGHTDNVGGDSQTNEVLSLERAKNVSDHLMKNGVLSQQIQYKGYGASKPIVNNLNAANRSKNRRVDFTILSISRK
ncbi:MAG: OmpA family protein [Saprospiraceae bacterium]